MAEQNRTCTVTMLPTAAKAPIANQRKRGPYSKTGNVVSPWELQRRRLERHQAPPVKQQLLGARKVGDVVVVWQSPGMNSNNGRIGVIERQSDGYGQEILAWQVRSIGPAFDLRGDPANGQISVAAFRDAWLLPVDRAAIDALAQKART